jgi:hypothetical protein
LADEGGDPLTVCQPQSDRRPTEIFSRIESLERSSYFFFNLNSVQPCPPIAANPPDDRKHLVITSAEHVRGSQVQADGAIGLVAARNTHEETRSNSSSSVQACIGPDEGPPRAASAGSRRDVC